MKRPVRIANASGFLGDRGSALLEMVTGGDIDFVTGDYLAEVTMLILGRQWMKDPKTGYAKAFLHHLEPAFAHVLTKGVKVVVNAGGLNPRGLADAVAALGAKLGLSPKVATVDGDNLRPRIEQLVKDGHPFTNLENGKPLPEDTRGVFTANAYLGAWGIVQALESGADIVICPRVTDASLVVGPAAYWHGWKQDDWDALAGAVVAGHIIECGCQATGGNYSSFATIADLTKPGFPLAEVAHDGTSVITKHEGTGGLVSVGTVTAQLVYEIGGTRYLNPDVTTALDTVHLEELGKDRVRASGVRGSPPPPTTKVAITTAGGFANEMTFVFTGLELEAKMALFEKGARAALEGVKARIEFQHIGGATKDASNENEATAFLRVIAASRDEAAVGRVFSSALIELGLASYPGLFALAPPGAGHPVGRFWPALVPQKVLEHRVTLPDGTTAAVPLPRSWRRSPLDAAAPGVERPRLRPHASGPARYARRRAVRRQGKRRQPGALGEERPRLRVAATHADDRAPQDAPARGRRARGHADDAPEPARRQLRHSRAARRGRRCDVPVRPTGQGARRVRPLPPRRDPGVPPPVTAARVVTGPWRAILALGVAACANPGGPYSDLASATLGDPVVDGGTAGAVAVRSGCSVPSDGVYAEELVEQAIARGLPTGTCGGVESGYVNGATLAAPPYCPHGSGSITRTTITGDGGTRECSVVTNLTGCVVAPDTTIDTFRETGVWSGDNSNFTGELTISAITAGVGCTDSYTVTLTRQ